MAESKKVAGVPVKRDFTGKQMKRLALNYKEFILDNGIKVEESPLEQLYITISKVFDSWSTAKAKTYRQIMRISDDWGTAVTVQAMIFGNLTRKSGSGVVFTHSPRWSGDMNACRWLKIRSKPWRRKKRNDSRILIRLVYKKLPS